MDEKPKPKPTVTTILLDPESWRLLRALATLRAQRLGGKPSASAVIRDLVHAEAGKVQATTEH